MEVGSAEAGVAVAVTGAEAGVGWERGVGLAAVASSAAAAGTAEGCSAGAPPCVPPAPMNPTQSRVLHR